MIDIKFRRPCQAWPVIAIVYIYFSKVHMNQIVKRDLNLSGRN